MMEAAIEVRNLGKRYQIGGRKEAYGTLRDTISSVATASLSWLRNQSRNSRLQEFWALRDISFDVQPGEVLGIIGRNGAGKSTLLKILARVTYPTEGQADIRGRVGSLLEVGTGFHPELTGRENVFLNGAVLGMKKTEIQSKFDEIVEFAEIGQFLDTPVKRYSSGMYMRLAFAVAAHLEPEILIVDEVLAVGDSAFQKKCLGKMGEVAHDGRTVLFVSHNLLAMESLCDRVVWLDRGQMVEKGQPGQVVSHYLETSYSPVPEQIWRDVQTAPGNDQVRLHRAAVRPMNGSPTDSISVRTPFLIEFEWWNLIPNTYLSPSLQLFNDQGILVFEAGQVDEPTWQGRPYDVGLYHDTCYIPNDLLNDGTYRVVLNIAKDQATLIHREDNILVFEIHDSMEKRAGWFGSWNGAVRPILNWETELLERDNSYSAKEVLSKTS